MLEKELQRSGRNKATQINKAYIEGGKYRRKFDKISNNAKLNKLLYDLAKHMLLHRTGTTFEDMYWIDVEKCVVVAQETDGEKEEKICYSNKTKKLIEQYKSLNTQLLFTVHTHPNSFPPSIADINSNFENNYCGGLIICHDGRVYYYRSNELVNPGYYDIKVAEYICRGYNEDEAQICAMSDMKEYFDIEFEEVCADDNGKRYI